MGAGCRGFESRHSDHVGMDFAPFRFFFKEKSVICAVIHPFCKRSYIRRFTAAATFLQQTGSVPKQYRQRPQCRALPFCTQKRTNLKRSPSFFCSGDDLLSRAASRQVPSALQSLTSVFGMGTGVTSASLPPNIQSTLCTLKIE